MNMIKITKPATTVKITRSFEGDDNTVKILSNLSIVFSFSTDRSKKKKKLVNKFFLIFLILFFFKKKKLIN